MSPMICAIPPEPEAASSAFGAAFDLALDTISQWRQQGHLREASVPRSGCPRISPVPLPAILLISEVIPTNDHSAILGEGS